MNNTNSVNNTLSFSQVKTLKEFCEGLFSEPCYREVIEQGLDKTSDFEVNNVRFIAVDVIDEIQAEELTNDLYCLGCFNASFIAEQANWPTELVEAAQAGEAYEALGKAIQDNCDMVEFAQAYSSADGYGHHFNRYDSEQDEITINGIDYLVFDNH